MLGRFFRGAALQCVPQDVKLVQILPTRLANEGPGAGDMVDKPFAGEAVDCFAHGNHADADLAGERAVHQSHARREFALGEFANDVAIRFFSQAAIHGKHKKWRVREVLDAS